MTNFRPRSRLVPILLVAALALGGCTRGPKFEPLGSGRPALGPLAERWMMIDARLPGRPAWSAAVSDENGWKMTQRSDEPGLRESPELADAAFIEHFRELLSTFETVERAGSGTDSGFGLAPYRLRVHLGGGPGSRGIDFGDPVGSGIYFRRFVTGGGDGKVLHVEKETWIGRGAVVAFLANFDSPTAFQWWAPYRGRPEDALRVRLEKAGPGAARWEFRREGEAWKPDSAGLVEKLLRQRIQRRDVAWKAAGAPDWRIEIEFAGKGAETIEIRFDLDRVLATNPARSPHALELYPEFAGNLRAFTQLRSTQVRSGTK